MKLVIIRGPSGSGKSTIAKALGGSMQHNWFEADMFFMSNGHYQFNPRELGKAHKWCQNAVYTALDLCIHYTYAGYKTDDLVIVSNTSTTLSEANDYIRIAQEVGVDELEIIRTPGPWIVDDLLVRNEHNVPREVLEKQLARYTPFDFETEWSDMSIFNGVK